MTSSPENLSHKRDSTEFRASILRSLFKICCVLVVTICLMGSGIVILFKTNGGRDFLLYELSKQTGIHISVTGIAGHFPTSLRIQQLILSDEDGPWAHLEDVILQWNVWKLLTGSVQINHFTIRALMIDRWPESPSSAPIVYKPISLLSSIGLDIRQLSVERIELAPPILGRKAVLQLLGWFRSSSLFPFIKEGIRARFPEMGLQLQLYDKLYDANFLANGSSHQGKMTFHAELQDKVNGFLPQVMGLDGVLPLNAKLDFAGPPEDLSFSLPIEAGAMKIQAAGRFNLPAATLQMQVRGYSPKITIIPSIGWSQANMAVTAWGNVFFPRVSGYLNVSGISFPSFQAQTFSLDLVDGNEGSTSAITHVKGRIDGLRLPSPIGQNLAGSPVKIEGSIDRTKETIPAEFHVTHPAISGDLILRTYPMVAGQLDLNIPDLSLWEKAIKWKAEGHAKISATVTDLLKYNKQKKIIHASGVLAITGGDRRLMQLIGSDGYVRLEANQTVHNRKKRFSLSDLEIRGHSLTLKGKGEQIGSNIKGQYHLSVANLLPVAKGLRGSFIADGQVSGVIGDFSTKATGRVWLESVLPLGQLDIQTEIHGLGRVPYGDLQVHGTLDNAPLLADMTVLQTDSNSRRILLRHLSWKSAGGEGDFTVGKDSFLPQSGFLNFEMSRLADLSGVFGQSIAGTFSTHLRMKEVTPDISQLQMDVRGNVQSSHIKVKQISAHGALSVGREPGQLDINAELRQIEIAGLNGNADIQAKGKSEQLDYQVRGDFSRGKVYRGNFKGAGKWKPFEKNLTFKQLHGNVNTTVVEVKKPFLIHYGDKILLKALGIFATEAGAPVAKVTVDGEVHPTLDVTVLMTNFSPGLTNWFLPSGNMVGNISGRARLQGSFTHPIGSIVMRGRGVRFSSGPAASLSDMSFTLDSRLKDQKMQIYGHFNMGDTTNLVLAGTIPLAKNGKLCARVEGQGDLSLTNGILGVAGRQVAGLTTVDMNVNGTWLAPYLSGAMIVKGVTFQDFIHGIMVSNINGLIQIEGSNVRVKNIKGEAGSGTVSVQGYMDISKPDLPIHMQIQAEKALLLNSDFASVVVDSNLAIDGTLKDKVGIKGKVDLRQVDVNVPSSLPRSVATIEVVNFGKKGEHVDGSPITWFAPAIGLDVSIVSGGSFFVRGQGLDAEVAGLITLSGTTNRPNVNGSFAMKRGDFALAGAELHFTKGKVGFDGIGFTNRLDPSIAFEASRNIDGTVAIMRVQGYTSSPQISFVSSPAYPQDQILAMLLFGTSVNNLTSWQIVEVGLALANLTTGGGAFDPIGKIRKGIGLDRLNITNSRDSSSGTQIEAGKNLFNRVYVGVKQGIQGNNNKAEVQIDLTKRLKLTSSLGTGGVISGPVTPDNDPGSSVGLSYQFRY